MRNPLLSRRVTPAPLTAAPGALPVESSHAPTVPTPPVVPTTTTLRSSPPVATDSNRIFPLPLFSDKQPVLEYIAYTLAANETKIFHVQGTMFYLRDATSGCNIRTNNSSSVGLYPPRTGRRYASSYFKWVEVTNPTGNPNIIALMIGNDEFLDKRIA